MPEGFQIPRVSSSEFLFDPVSSASGIPAVECSMTDAAESTDNDAETAEEAFAKPGPRKRIKTVLDHGTDFDAFVLAFPWVKPSRRDAYL